MDTNTIDLDGAFEQALAAELKKRPPTADSIHEASHAVAARHYGVPVMRIELMPEPGKLGTIRYGQHAGCLPVLARASISYAGYAGEMLSGVPHAVAWGGAANDMRAVIGLLSVFSDADAMKAHIRSDTVQILLENWPRVLTLAGKLDWCQRLERAALEALGF